MLIIMLREVRRVLVGAVLSCLLLVSVATFVGAGDDLRNVNQCLPTKENGVAFASTAPRDNKVIGRVTNPTPAITGKREIKEFVLVASRLKKAKWFPLNTTLIGIDTNNTCFNYEPMSPQFIHLNHYMPMSLAKNLALQKFKWIAAQPDGKSYIKGLLTIDAVDPKRVSTDREGSQTQMPNPTALVAEEAWALKQLKYTIPREVYIFPTAKEPWKFTDPSPVRFLEN